MWTHDNGHLSVDELEERYVACCNVGQGHTVSQVSATTMFGER